ncbi:MAG: hypothetical protein D6820_16860 [Lentisphaerae bacterium]|nr:MAG: hypothetical protein D6820_16860 [Lentisphaerota bacterium]
MGGGYVTRGAIDELVRHALSKMSHQHFVANQMCHDCLVALGESPAAIHIVGAPDLDLLTDIPAVTPHEFLPRYGIDPDRPFCLVTIHPEPRHPNLIHAIDQCFTALSEVPCQLLITAPAPDPGAEYILQRIDQLCAQREDCHYHPSLGYSNYIQTMRLAHAMIGNTSSGIIEASFLGIPTIDIGDRQSGRLRGQHIIHCEWDARNIIHAIRKLDDPAFRHHICTPQTIYGDGHAAEKIYAILKQLPATIPINKTFTPVK